MMKISNFVTEEQSTKSYIKFTLETWKLCWCIQLFGMIHVACMSYVSYTCKSTRMASGAVGILFGEMVGIWVVYDV